MNNAQNFFERLKRLREEQTKSLHVSQQPLYLQAPEPEWREEPTKEPRASDKQGEYIDLDLAETYIDFDIS